MSPSLTEIERLHLRLLLAVAVLAQLTGWISAVGVLLGGAVMGLNVWLMRRGFALWLSPARRWRTGLMVGVGLLKASLFLGLVGMLFWRLRIDALAVAVGASVLLVASVAASLRSRPALA